MGCAQSSLEPVNSANTSDELAKPARGPGTADITQKYQPLQSTETLNTDLPCPNIVTDGPAAASSSDERAIPQRSSNRQLNPRIEGALDNSRSTRNDGVGITALVDASVSVSGTPPPGWISSPAQPTGTTTATSPSLQQLDAIVVGQTQSPARAPLRSAASQAGGAQRALLPPLQPPPLPTPQQQRLIKPDADVGRQTALVTGRLQQPQRLHPAGLPMDNRMLVLIVWDIENVRCPRGNGPWDSVLTPAKVLGYIKQHFIYEPGRVEYRTVAAVTPKSLSIIQKRYPGFVEQMVPELTLLVASAQEPKRNADVMLKKELYRFVSEHAHIARLYPGQLTVVLLSGDEDFLEPVQVALNSGFAVELMHHDKPSWALHNQQGYARSPLLWADFLKQRSGADIVILPYNGRQ